MLISFCVPRFYHFKKGVFLNTRKIRSAKNGKFCAFSIHQRNYFYSPISNSKNYLCSQLVLAAGNLNLSVPDTKIFTGYENRGLLR
jgi:hypothetical protein